MLANRSRISRCSSNSQFSLPYERNQLPESSCDSYANRTAMWLPSKAQSSLISR